MKIRNYRFFEVLCILRREIQIRTFSRQFGLNNIFAVRGLIKFFSFHSTAGLRKIFMGSGT